jgi:hypothetical protein
MITPARITPPPPLQWTPLGRGGGTPLGALKPKPRVCSLLPGGAARSVMNLRLLGPVPHSATRAPGATPLARKQKGKQSGGKQEKRKGRRRRKRHKFRGHHRRCVERCRHHLGASTFRPPSVLTTDPGEPGQRAKPAVTPSLLPMEPCKKAVRVQPKFLFLQPR